MSDDEAFGSDSSDDDYVPIEGEAVSEEEGSGDEEDATLLAKDAEGEDGEGKHKKKSKTKKELGRGKRIGGIKLDEGDQGVEENKEEKVDFKEEEKKLKEQEKEVKEKKKADDLWASFMSDVGGPKPKPKPTPVVPSSIGSLSSIKKPAACSTTKPFSSPSPATATESPIASSSKVKITKEYDFAGEKVMITKEVDANSAEAKKVESKEASENKAAEKPAVGLGVKRPGGGLSDLVGKLNKAPKISTLDKSKLDWESFKQENRLTEELSTHNKGKEGFLERKAFLERADLRQFEIEKSLRLSNSKR